MYDGKAEKPKKVAENRKKGKNSAENWKKKCVGNRKNDIFEPRKTGKVKNNCGKRKTVCENSGKLF